MNEQSCGFKAPEDMDLRAVFFDLDGTLLPMDLDEFLKCYFGSIAGFMARAGADPADFERGLSAGIAAMRDHGLDTTNDQEFWGAFMRYNDGYWSDWVDRFDAYYREVFPEVGRMVSPDPNAARAVKVLAEKGYPLLLTTMPLFPPAAVDERLRWAGLDPALFKRTTCFDNSRSTKPHAAYFVENMLAADVPAEKVLMVGNNTVEDLACCALGSDAFLVTDNLLNPDGLDVASVRNGTLEEFASWVERLPVCSNPAAPIERGAVDPTFTGAALARLDMARREGADA